MNILLVNTYHYSSGGDWTHTESLKKMYEDKGHNVLDFAMDDEKNVESDYKNYFVSNINFEQINKKRTIENGFKIISRTVFSFEAKRKIKALLNEYTVDLVHMQNFLHHISPSILLEIKKKKIPIIWTLHDYSLLCPNATFLSNGIICENCKFSRYYYCTLKRCKKASFMASMVATLEAYIHKFLNIYRNIDYFIAPSNFLYNKFQEFNFIKDKVFQIFNFLDQENFNENNIPGEYALYIGRLSYEKGIPTLLDASEDCHIPIKIVGDGPLKDIVKVSEKENKNIQYLGKKNKKEVIYLLDHCKFLIIPSECYENLPFTILEAFARSKPILASDLGEMLELVGNKNERGLIFKHKNVDDLREKINYFTAVPEQELMSMSINAFRYACDNFTRKKYIEKLNRLLKKFNLQI